MKLLGLVLLLVLQYLALPIVGGVGLGINAKFKGRSPAWLWWLLQVLFILILLAGLAWLGLTVAYLCIDGVDVFNQLFFS